MPDLRRLSLRRSSSAIIALSLVATFACASESAHARKTNRAKPVSSVRRATIVPVYYINTDPPTGGTSEVVLEIRPSRDGKTSVGIAEEYLGGAGPMWRASAWIAAFNACLYTGKDFTDYRFLVDSTGHIDGPSAGMLMTAGFVALLENRKIDPQATMTGTINPDMSAGPVGGIPFKLGGAKRAGIKWFGYPLGTRRSPGLGGKIVDLEREAKKLGIRATEIRNLDEAVAHLTGKRRRRRPMLDEREMELSVSEVERIEAEVTRVQSAFAKTVQAVVPLLKKMGALELAPVGASLQEAARLEKAAAAALAEGSFAAAKVDYLRGHAMIINALGMGLLRQGLMQQDFSAFETQVAKLQKSVRQKEAKLEAMVTIARRLRSAGSIVAAVEGYRDFASALVMAQMATEEIGQNIGELRKLQQGQTADLQRAMSALALPFVYLTIADHQLSLALMRMERPIIVGGKKVRDDVIISLARSYASAGNASLEYVDAVFTGEQAKMQGMTLAQAQVAFTAMDQSYGRTRRIAALARRVSDHPAQRLLALAAGMESWIAGGELVNKYYALAAQKQPDGSLLIKRRRALSEQLKLARRSALEAGLAAEQTSGGLPLPVKMAFAYAEARREGSDEDKIEALSSYWWSALLGRLVARLEKDS